MKRPPVILLALLRLLPTVSYGIASLLMPLLIYRVSGEASAAALYGTANLLFASGTQLVTGRLCDRIPYPRITITLTALMSLTSLITALVTESLVGLFVIGVLAMGAAWALAVTVPGLIGAISREGEQGRTLGFIHLSWYAGMIAGTQLGGWLVDYGSDIPFIVGGLLNLLAVVAAVALARYLRGAPQPASIPAPVEE